LKLLFESIVAAILEAKITIKFNFYGLEVKMETSLKKTLVKLKPAAVVVMV